MMLVSMTVLSFAMRVFEYGVKDPSNTTSLKGDGNDLQSLLNCFWLIIVTMTTVGYGDYFPKSHLGRFIGVVACIIGMLIVSLIVVSLAVISEFTSEEKKAYSLLKKLQADDNAYNKAIKVIIGVLKLRKLVVRSKQQSKKTNFLKESFILLTTLKKEISSFKNDYKIANSYSLPIDEMLKKLESKIKGDIKQLTENIKKLSSVEGELDKISKQQDDIRSKIEMIMMRQDKIAKYIVKVNNDNYKRFVVEKFKEEVIEELDDEILSERKGVSDNKADDDSSINTKNTNKDAAVTALNYIEDINNKDCKDFEDCIKSNNNEKNEENLTDNKLNESSVLRLRSHQAYENAKSNLNASSSFNEELKLVNNPEEDEKCEDIHFKKESEDSKKNNQESRNSNKIDSNKDIHVKDFLLKMDDINNMIKNNFSSLSDSAKNNSFVKESRSSKKKIKSGKELVGSGLGIYNEDFKAGNDYNLEKVYFGKSEKEHHE